MTRIKICGLTREQDVHQALELGADLLGFIHVPRSPRHVPLERLADLIPNRDGVRTVVVVQDADPADLDRLRDRLRFDWFQFHGAESAETVKRWGGYKVFHIKDREPAEAEIAPFGEPFLLDTQVGKARGGTGVSFDWTILARIRGRCLVAGGLNPDNVARLIADHAPWGVDVSSGVEQSPGIKDPHKMARFFEETRRGS